MSFVIAVYVNEGIVVASDRRTTYSKTQNDERKTTFYIGVHTTDSTDKTFVCPNGASISTCGDASLLGKPITGYIQEFIRTRVSKDCSIADMPEELIKYFHALSEIPDTVFLIAGYETSEDGTKRQRIQKVALRSKAVTEIDTSCQGAVWEGEITTLVRLIQNVAMKTENGYQDLPYEEILWGYFTLQDAVDFARYAVETTIQTMRFKNVIETVGGSIDVLVITPEETKWLQKEVLC